MKLTAYSEETKNILRVKEEFYDLTRVPQLDEFIKYVNSQNCLQVTGEGMQTAMWSSWEKDQRHMHMGARINMLSTCISQRILLQIHSILEAWAASGKIEKQEADDLNSLLLADFDGMNRCLEHSARIRGMIHMLHHRVVSEDMNIPVKNRGPLLNLPLSHDSIFGQGLTEKLESQDKYAREFHAAAKDLALQTKQHSSYKKRPAEASEQQLQKVMKPVTQAPRQYDHQPF